MSEDNFNPDLTEEEKAEWARNYKWKPKKRLTKLSEVHLKSEKLVELLEDREKKRKKYRRNKESLWGAKQNEQQKLLYKYNEEYRNRCLYRQAVRNYKRRFANSDTWINKYKKDYSKNLEKYADTYMGDYGEASLGFSVKKLTNYLPIGLSIVRRLLESDVLPPPLYSGNKVLKKSIDPNKENYYTLEEAEIILKIFLRYWKSSKRVSTDNQEMWLKKSFWKQLVKYRNG